MLGPTQIQPYLLPDSVANNIAAVTRRDSFATTLAANLSISPASASASASAPASGSAAVGGYSPYSNTMQRYGFATSPQQQEYGYDYMSQSQHQYQPQSKLHLQAQTLTQTESSSRRSAPRESSDRRYSASARGVRFPHPRMLAISYYMYTLGWRS